MGGVGQDRPYWCKLHGEIKLNLHPAGELPESEWGGLWIEDVY